MLRDHLKLSMLILTLAAPPAGAQALPPDTTVALTIHNVPGDANSGISLFVVLHLSPALVDENAIGWGITGAEFYESTETGLWQMWEAGALTVQDSTDGLWWIVHSDPDNPVEADFTLLPELDARATSIVPGEPDLLFRIAPSLSAFIGDPPLPYGDKTAYGCYTAVRDGSLCACDDCTLDCLDDDEPIEVEPDPNL